MLQSNLDGPFSSADGFLGVMSKSKKTMELFMLMSTLYTMHGFLFNFVICLIFNDFILVLLCGI